MLRELFQELGIPEDYGRDAELPMFEEGRDLVEAGVNLVGRMQRLTSTTARRWQAMVEAAACDEIQLLIVSGYRSFEYQAALIRSKIEAGQTVEEILKVNTAPGYSEHHSGHAVDIATPGSRPLTEDFENTEAFRWLRAEAGQFGFSMSYPRDNALGISYEPWHWAKKDG